MIALYDFSEKSILFMAGHKFDLYVLYLYVL